MAGVKDFIVKTLPNGFEPVSIEEEILNFKRTNKHQPTIIIDLYAIPLHSNKYNNLCGGRNTHCTELINFFERLKQLNVHLVFVKKINKVDASLDDRMRKKNRTQMDVVDDLRRDMQFEEIIQKYGHRLDYPVLIKSDMNIIASKYGTMIPTINYEDVAPYLATLAYNFDALGIISDKISLMFFKGKYKFWSAVNLNLETLQTRKFDRKGFREYLELTDEQMPIFSTLLGNHSISFDTVKKFHLKFGEDLVENLASYVNNFSKNLTEEDINIIASDIECNQNTNLNIGNLIKTSIKSIELVEIKSPEDEILEFIWETMSPDLYLIMTNLPIVITCSFFDHKNRNNLLYPDIILPLIQKKIGILWKHKNDPNLIYTFYSQRRNVRYKSTEIVKPIIPDFHVPPLLQLFDQKKYPLLNTIRYELLCWAISDKLKPTILKNIPKDYLIEVLTLRFMVNEKLLRIFEADAILLTTNAVLEKRIPKDIPHPTYLKTRPFFLAHLFTELRYQIQRIVETVGLQDRINVFNFDGVYFHTMYMDWAGMQPNERMNLFRNHPPLTALMQVYRDHDRDERINARSEYDWRCNSSNARSEYDWRSNSSNASNTSGSQPINFLFKNDNTREMNNPKGFNRNFNRAHYNSRFNRGSQSNYKSN